MSDNISKPETSLQITLALVESRCIFFSLTDYALSNKREIPFDGYEYRFNLRFEVIEIEKKVQILTEISLFDKQGLEIKPQLSELRSKVIFSVINFEDLITKKSENNFEINDSLIKLCFSAALSTTRGMYNVKLENTLYSNSVLPLIDVAKLIVKKV